MRGPSSPALLSRDYLCDLMKFCAYVVSMRYAKAEPLQFEFSTNELTPTTGPDPDCSSSARSNRP